MEWASLHIGSSPLPTGQGDGKLCVASLRPAFTLQGLSGSGWIVWIVGADT